MGLAISVGYLADILQNDPDEAYRIRADFGRVNEFLESVGLPTHAEPETCEGFSCDMWGYSGLHYLRRFAAHLDLRGTLPEPGDQDSSHDPVLAVSGVPATW